MAKIKSLSDDELRNFVTDEIAQEEGYPNAEVYWLESDLVKLAGKWRRTKDETLVQEYHQLFYQLLKKGWNPRLLDVQGRLAKELMPQEYQDFVK